MTAKINHITEDLVEQLAIIAYEQTRIQNGDIPIPSWTGAGAMTRYNIKKDVLGVLRITVPVLIEQGWKPPAVEVLTVVNSAEDIEALPLGTVIRSLLFGVTRERFMGGWLAVNGDEPAESSDIAGRDHIVLYRREVCDAVL